MALSNAAKSRMRVLMGGEEKYDAVAKEVLEVFEANSIAVATNVPDLTENSGAIGGTNDGDLPNLTASYVARTGSNSGTADGAYQAEGTLALSTSNTYTDAAVNAAVNTILAKLENNIAENSAVIGQLAADNVALRAAARENSAKINALIDALVASGAMSS